MSDPSDAYGSAVADILNSRSRETSWKPSVELQLRVTNRRALSSQQGLSMDERVQLRSFFGDRVDDELANEENSVEVADVVDETGAVRYRLYGWNYGVGYLMPASGTDVVAMGCQHDIEHWKLAQRDLFWAMDRALREPGHGFEQPLYFCWSDDTCWAKLSS